MRQFYHRNDISRMAPGKRDVVTVCSCNGKEKVQKRHLYMSIKDTSNFFLTEHPNVKIGLTKFGYLRPDHVKFLLKYQPMCTHVSTIKASFSHLIRFINMFKKFLFTARHLLKIVFCLLMKPAGMVIVIMISAALAQLMQNQKIAISQQNG